MYTFLSSAILVKTTGNYVSAVLSVVCKLVLMYNFLKIIFKLYLINARNREHIKLLFSDDSK